ncbi:MAG: putative zinc-binding metallopeptidase, partial [Bacteroidota bacterium]
MKLFKCNHCGQPIYFENTFCIPCKASLGFDSQRMEMVSLHEEADNSYSLFAGEEVAIPLVRYKYCINKKYNVCNWLLAYDDNAQYCFACNLNRTIPDLTLPDHLVKWAQIEAAKHRLVYSLLRFQLPVISKFQDEEKGIAFDFLSD